MTEVMEIQAESPKYHVLFIPGNPGYILLLYAQCILLLDFFVVFNTFWFGNLSGVVSFYNDFLESLHQFLDGNASITGIYIYIPTPLSEFDSIGL